MVREAVKAIAALWVFRKLVTPLGSAKAEGLRQSGLNVF